MPADTVPTPATRAPQLPVMLPPDFITIPELIRRARVAEEAGSEQIWLEQMPDRRDIGILAAALATATTKPMIGTSILPIYFRHPVAMAQLAATLDELSGGRFGLGLGLSHQFINEFQLGLTMGRPVAAMREYTQIVRALLRDGTAQVEGEYFTARINYTAPRRPDLPIYLAALRPRMIQLAVDEGDGLLLWMSSADFVRDQIVPEVEKACARRGKDPASFPILAMVQTCLTDRLDEQRQIYRKIVAGYAMMPYYRRVLEASGLQHKLARGGMDEVIRELIILTDDEKEIEERLRTFRDAGCVPVPTFSACTPEEFDATLATVRDA
jgi:F420-dependent oxidoreductase-like protein